ncbi:hypothetical protein [Aliiglaciecola litoralis]|uniref:Uncharacterized protein n=1 Tax=Aliiglaciecola litoralis TaxID=582857 RepID=A0ABN1LS83_9ALTE
MSEETIDLSKSGDTNTDSVIELSAGEKAQIQMTYWVLGGVFVLFILVFCAYIFTGDGRSEFVEQVNALCMGNSIQTDDISQKVKEFCTKNQPIKDVANTAAAQVFDFCKNFLPPIVTLVLGAHYVHKSNNGNS